MKSWKSRIAAFLSVVVGFLLAYNVVRSVAAGDPSRPRKEDIATAGRTAAAPSADERMEVPAGDFLFGNAIVEPRVREIRVAAEVSGRVARVLVEEGERVEAGAVLVELESAVERAQLAAAEADVAAAEAELQRVTRGNRVEDVEASIAEAQAATARASLSSGVASRVTTAAAGGGATRDEVERAQRQAEVDSASARLAEARQRAAVRGSRREDVAAARARLLGAQARRDLANAQAEARNVRAPIAGEVLQIKVFAGEYYQPGGDPLLVLGDTTTLRARIDVDERDVGRLRVGAAVLLRALAYPGVDIDARVVQIGLRMGRKNVRSDDPVERNDTKILEVVAELAAPDGEHRLYVGQRLMAYVSASP